MHAELMEFHGICGDELGISFHGNSRGVHRIGAVYGDLTNNNREMTGNYSLLIEQFAIWKLWPTNLAEPFFSSKQ